MNLLLIILNIKTKKFLKDLYYRFNNESDLSLLIKNIKNSLELYGSLENLLNKIIQSHMKTYFRHFLNSAGLSVFIIKRF
ncbi:MAG: hypothetical protein IPJ45_14200 [Ignavibacteria bacterium]|nr:hypothetical protein [Ignavibacteria bacterium]